MLHAKHHQVISTSRAVRDLRTSVRGQASWHSALGLRMQAIGSRATLHARLLPCIGTAHENKRSIFNNGTKVPNERPVLREAFIAARSACL
jgi:hypothetical protein